MSDSHHLINEPIAHPLRENSEHEKERARNIIPILFSPGE